MLTLVSLMLMLLFTPAKVLAQTDYDTSVTFTALAGSGSYTNEGWEKLFDGKKTSSDGTKWCCSFSSGDTRYVIFEASKSGIPVGYTITTANDNSQNHGRNPLSWKLYGNTEGTSGEWTLIHEVTNDTQLEDVDYTSYDYTCTCDAYYKYFMWEVTAVHSGNTLQVGEFELKLVTCSHKDAQGQSALTEVSKTAATCIRPAYTTYECSICKQNVEVEGGDPAPHTLTHHDAKDAKCVETGNIEYWQCSVCNKTFSDSNAATEVTDLTVAAKGHSYDKDFVCTICNYEDPRFKLITLCDGVTITSFEDNDYPWQVMDLSAEGMTELGLDIPADSKGIMSNNYHVARSSSIFTINIKVDKLVKLTFDYAISSESEYDKLCVYLDGESSYVTPSGVVKNSSSIFLYPGDNKVVFAYEKDSSTDNGADRVVVYNIKTTQQFEIYGSVTEDKTLIFRKFSDGESLSNVTLLDDIKAPSTHVRSSSINKVVIEPSFKGYELNSLNKLFYRCTSLQTITGLGNLNTSKVTDMSYMFYRCTSLQTITGLGNLNTSKVTDMSYMFYGCRALGEFDIEKLNTSNVTNMQNMFYNCSSPSSLDLSGFDTRNVTNMSRMFDACYTLRHIYVSDKFTTDEVVSSYNMFNGCTNLRNYDASSVDMTHANYGSDGYLEACYKVGDEYTPLTGDELKTTTLELKDGSDFMASAPFTAETVTYSRTLADGTSWNSLCLPFEVSLAGQNFRAFKLLSHSGNAVELEELETSIAAGTPVLIKMNAGETALSIIAQDQAIVTDVQQGSSTEDGGLQLVGLYTKKMFSKDADNDCYILKANKLMNPAKILEKTSTQTVGSKGFRAYMKEKTQPSAAPKMYSLSIGSEETALDMLQNDADAQAEYYDLQGNRLREPQKGVNIIKRAGKTMKVIIK